MLPADLWQSNIEKSISGLTQIRSDWPYQAIIKAAKANKCDLVFMASHGRRGIAGLLIGRETNKVLTHCKLPVLVYR
jgi:nucleotide-binding universal stress UspA family protein